MRIKSAAVSLIGMQLALLSAPALARSPGLEGLVAVVPICAAILAFVWTLVVVGLFYKAESLRTRFFVWLLSACCTTLILVGVTHFSFNTFVVAEYRFFVLCALVAASIAALYLPVALVRKSLGMRMLFWSKEAE
jgi:hypothetical protein